MEERELTTNTAISIDDIDPALWNLSLTALKLAPLTRVHYI